MKLLLASIFCATAVCLAAPGAGSAKETPRRPILLQQCEGLAPQQAIAACDTLLTLNQFDDPLQHSMVLVWRGEAYQAIGAFPQALANFDRAIAADEMNAEAYVARAMWRAWLGETEEDAYAAIDDLLRALERNPDHVVALLEYAWFDELYWLDEPGERPLDHARRLAPEDPYLYYTLARLEGVKDNPDLSLLRILIDEAIVRAPNDLRFRDYRGFFRESHGDNEGALADFDFILNHKPWEHSAHFGRAAALDNVQRYEDAVSAYTSSLLWREYVGSLNNRCLARMRSGRDFHLARQDCERAERMDPEDPRVLGNLALAMFFLGETDAALRKADRAASRDPSLGRTYYIRYLIYRTQGHDNWARQERERALKADPEVVSRMADVEKWFPQPVSK